MVDGNLDDLFGELEKEFGESKKEQPKEQPKSEESTTTSVQPQQQEQSQIQVTPQQTQLPQDETLQVIQPPQSQEETKQHDQMTGKETSFDLTPEVQSQTPVQSVPQTETEKKPGDVLASIFGEEEIIDESFTFEPESPEPKEVWLIAGEKNEGKTAAAFSFINRPNTKLIVCIAFDTKSARTWWNMYNGDPRIVVFSGLKYFKYGTKEEITKAAARTFAYIMKLLDSLKEGIPINIGGKQVLVKDPDWIVIDNTEVFMRICEFTARYYWKLPPFSGAEWKLWDERNYYVREMFFKCYDVAKKGVIYTTYLKTDDVLIEGGQTIRRKETPKWVEAIKYETDYVIKVWRDSTGRKFYAEVLGSKDDKLVPTGTIYDITDVGLWSAISQRRVKTS